MAQESGGSEEVPWGMLCHAPANNQSPPQPSPDPGQFVAFHKDPVGDFVPMTINGDPGMYRKWVSLTIVVEEVTRTMDNDLDLPPYNGPVDLKWTVTQAASWWESEDDPNQTAGHTPKDLRTCANPIFRTAKASCDDVPGEKEISFTLTPNEIEEDTDAATSIKVSTQLAVEENNQEGSIKFRGRVTHPNGGEGDWEVVEIKFGKHPVTYRMGDE